MNHHEPLGNIINHYYQPSTNIINHHYSLLRLLIIPYYGCLLSPIIVAYYLLAKPIFYQQKTIIHDHLTINHQRALCSALPWASLFWKCGSSTPKHAAGHRLSQAINHFIRLDALIVKLIH